MDQEYNVHGVKLSDTTCLIRAVSSLAVAVIWQVAAVKNRTLWTTCACCHDASKYTLVVNFNIMRYINSRLTYRYLRD